MNSFPTHGRISCSICFDRPAIWGVTKQIAADGWALENNPCAWGSESPRFALLGFSKGERQSKGIGSRIHNEIPFAGFRDRLDAGLRKLGLFGETETISDHLKNTESDWAFGSVVRCSLEKDSSKSGNIIPQASGGSYRLWRDNCSRTFLAQLPERLKVVVMLSNTDSYVKECFLRIKELHPSTKMLNPVAYSNGSVTWIHIVHFGGQGFNWMSDWLNEAPNKAGQKGAWAVQAAGYALRSE